MFPSFLCNRTMEQQHQRTQQGIAEPCTCLWSRDPWRLRCQQQASCHTCIVACAGGAADASLAQYVGAEHPPLQTSGFWALSPGRSTGSECPRSSTGCWAGPASAVPAAVESAKHTRLKVQWATQGVYQDSHPTTWFSRCEGQAEAGELKSLT